MPMPVRPQGGSGRVRPPGLGGLAVTRVQMQKPWCAFEVRDAAGASQVVGMLTRALVSLQGVGVNMVVEVRGARCSAAGHQAGVGTPVHVSQG